MKAEKQHTVMCGQRPRRPFRRHRPVIRAIREPIIIRGVRLEVLRLDFDRPVHLRARKRLTGVDG